MLAECHTFSNLDTVSLFLPHGYSSVAVFASLSIGLLAYSFYPTALVRFACSLFMRSGARFRAADETGIVPLPSLRALGAQAKALAELMQVWHALT